MLESILHFFRSLYDPEGLKELIRSGGAPLVCTIVFVETGFFVGFFLPGDSLLVTAGIFAAAGVVPLRSDTGSDGRRGRLCTDEKSRSFSAAATCNERTIFMRSTAGGP